MFAFTSTSLFTKLVVNSFQLNPFHIPDSTFANLPHAFKPQMTKDGRMIGQISAVKKPKNQEYKDKVEKDEENNGTTSITKV